MPKPHSLDFRTCCWEATLYSQRVCLVSSQFLASVNRLKNEKLKELEIGLQKLLQVNV